MVAAEPIVPAPRVMPLPAMPTPKSIARPVYRPRAPRQYVPTIPPIGAAMIARRKRRRLVAPFILILLGGIASALAVPAIYEALVR